MKRSPVSGHIRLDSFGTSDDTISLAIQVVGVLAAFVTIAMLMGVLFQM